MGTPSETTTARRLRKALYFSASVLLAAILILAGYVAFRSRSAPGEWLGYLLLGSVIATCVSGMARFAYVLFAELQAPLNELLITFLFAGGVMAVLRSALKDTIDDDQTAQWIVFMLLICAGVLMGSIWGWSLIKRLGRCNARQRLRLLAYGWIGIVGVTGAAVFAFLNLILIANSMAGDHVFNSSFGKMYFGHLLAIPLAIPALLLEHRIRKSAAQVAAQNQIDTKPEAAVIETIPINRHPVSATSTPPGTPSI